MKPRLWLDPPYLPRLHLNQEAGKGAPLAPKAVSKPGGWSQQPWESPIAVSVPLVPAGPSMSRQWLPMLEIAPVGTVTKKGWAGASWHAASGLVVICILGF